MWIDPESHKIVGSALEKLRERAGVTQVQLARKLGKPQSFVSSFERGQRRVDLLEFSSIVNALGGDPGRVANSVFRSIEPKARSRTRP